MRKDYKRAAKAEAVMNFVRKRFETALAEDLEKGICESRAAYEHIIGCIEYAKMCIRCRRTGYVLLASAFIAWAINMLVLIMNLLKL